MKTRYHIVFASAVTVIFTATSIWFGNNTNTTTQQSNEAHITTAEDTSVSHITKQPSIVSPDAEEYIAMTTESALELNTPNVHSIIPENTAMVIEKIPSIKILNERYTENEILDENWDEEASLAAKGNQWENLSFNEVLAKKQVHLMQNQLVESLYESGNNYVKESQIQQVIGASFALIDLQCGLSNCRVVAQVPHAASQYELIKSLPQQLDWLSQSFAEVEINPDDSRIVTLYLTLKSNSNEV